MKKKITRFLVILIAVICQAGISSLPVYSQGYHKLIRTNTYWDDYIKSDEPIFNNCYASANRIYFTGNDTIIEGITYQNSRQYNFSGYNPVPGVMCPPLVINNFSYPTGSFIREDTLTRKVYIYDVNHTPHDQLLYDFSLQVGDTLKSEYNGNGYLVLTAIDTVTLNNAELRQRFTFGSPEMVYYIESLGGSQGLFNPILWIPESLGGYFCISETDISLWGSECDIYFVGINEPQESRVFLYPIPATDRITIEISGVTEVSNVAIANIEGQQFITCQITETKTQLDISDLPSGVYIVRLTGERTVQVGKFIKQ